MLIFVLPAEKFCYGIVQPGTPVEGGSPVIRVADLTGNRLRSDSVLRIDPEIEKKYARSRIRAGDVLVSLVGSMGQVVIAGEEVEGWNLARAVGLIPPRDAHHAAWLRYSLLAPAGQAFIREHANTTVQATFNLRDLARLPVPYPSRVGRDAIIATLGALDDKIELNRRMGATLEGMARALYRSWFVDFDPVRAKMAGRAPAHMDPATAALFPDRLGEEGLPERWEMGTIGDVAKTVGGATPSTKQDQFWGGDHAWATPRDLSRQGRSILFSTDRQLTDAGLAKISSGLSPAGSVLLSSRAPIGYVTIAQVPVAVNQGFIVLRETNKMSTSEAFCWLHENMDVIKSNANGSTFQEISKKNFRPLPCVIAPPKVRKAFNALANSMFERMTIAFRESDTLSALRDALLPRLMSGELRVPEAEGAVAAAS